MGVLQCNRKNCSNIMCDRYSSEYGYICYECFEELKHWPFSIEQFMQKEKASEFSNRNNVKRLESIFQIR